MKPSDLSEIKHLYALDPEQSSISRISGCYVNGEKNKVVQFADTFLTLPEEDRFKYLELFRKCFSGTRDKNLLLLRQEQIHRDDHSGDMTTDEVKLLQALVETDLKDEDTLQEFYDRVIEHYNYIDNYLILLARQDYDVPGKTLDGMSLDDASEEVYRHVVCAICPVKPTKPGLGYDPAVNAFHNLTTGQIVGAPMNGFLYPAFIDRSQDPDHILYYTKDSVDIRAQFANAVLGGITPLAAAGQKNVFTTLLTDTLEEDIELETVLQIQENLQNLVKEKKEEQESPVLKKDDVCRILRESGIEEEKLKDMDQRFDEAFVFDPGTDEESKEAENGEEQTEMPEPEKVFVASNLIPGRKLEVKNADFTIRINTDRTELLETRVIDGKKCLLIELEDGVYVNGIPIGVRGME